MANDNKIQSFSALDIERYHKGLLSSKEMHDLEKAALDDPFLADALEGYAVPGVQVSADIAELKKRLADRTTETKVIAMGGSQKKGFPWFRAAAAVVIITGAGLLANQFLFNKKSTGIAQINTNKPADNSTAKTQTDSSPISGNKATRSATEKVNATVIHNEIVTTNGPVGNTTPGDLTQGTKGNGAIEKKSNAGETPGAPNPVAATESPKVITERRDETVARGYVDDTKKEDAKKVAIVSTNNKVQDKEREKDANVMEADDAVASNNRNATAIARKTEEQNYRNQKNNVFRGRVTDANNVGVPFANVTNVDDNAGTYTDAKGNFTLTSPDTTLTVQVRSIGFDNTNVQLRNAAPTNQVILQDDRKSLSEVVVSNQKPNVAARSRDANKTLQEEPEPADGWDNYDAYIANNL
jgi:CarboxypepD_reg-like domain